ncbi:MAG: hypothetical protein IKL05_02345 [Clostridia bacterium]|nr:hypothetical protein [Clostridia bacterium]
MQIIGIDIGTTSICGVTIDTKSGKILDSKTVVSNAFIKGAQPWEKIQDPQKIVSIATEILDGLICKDTVAIGVTGQMHGIVYVDKDGSAVSPLYTWQDERGNLPYKDTTYAKHLGSFSGYGNVTDFYNRENGLRPKDAVGYCTIHDWFVMQLCGNKKPLLHSSDAASFGLYDLKENKFNYDVDLDVTSDYCVAGSYKSIPVSIAIGDNQASVFSTIADENNILLNVGTGSQVSIISDRILAGTNIETRPYFDGKYLVVGAALCGGRAFSMLKDFYAEIIGYATDITDKQVYAIMDKMLENAEGTTVTADTRFAGTRSDTSIKGGIFGLTVENFKPLDISLAILQGMITELYDMYAEMNTKKVGVVASGNGIRKNKPLIALAEKQFGAALKLPSHMEEAAFGAALFGAISAGVYSSAEQAQKLIRYI